MLCVALVFTPEASAQTTAARFGRLWDGVRVIDKAVVIVEGNRIVRVTTG